jgi:hypothetical protein
MKRKILVIALVGVVAACSKKKEDVAKGTVTPDGGAAPVGPVIPVPVAEKPASDSTALWAFAPPEATLGLVVADGAAKRWVESGGIALTSLFVQPWAAKGRAAIDESLKKAGFDWLTVAGWRSIGADLEKGVALFVDGQAGQEPILAIVPVVDRAAWVKYHEGTTEKIAGRDVDKFKKVVCTDAGGRYVCAKDLAAIDAAAKTHDSPLATAVKALPATDRGDVEVYFDLARSPGAADMRRELEPLGEVNVLGGSARLETSGLTVRVYGKGKLEGPAAAMVKSIPPSPDMLARARGATTLWWWRVDPMAWQMVPDEEIVAGLRLTEITRELAGEGALLTVGQGALGGQILLRTRDVAATRTLVDKLCRYAQEGQLGLELEDVTKKEGSCAGSVEKAALAKLDMPELEISLAADVGPLLALGLGSNASTDAKWSPNDMAGSPVVREMFKNPATLLAWSASLDVDLDALPMQLLKDFEKDESTKVVKGVIAWVASHVYEVGFAVSTSPTEIRGTLRVTTFGADPAGARDAYEAALNKRAAKDRAAYTAAMVDLEKKFPGSLVAKRAEQVRAGVPVVGPAGAVIFGGAAVAYLFARNFEESMKSLDTDLNEAPPVEPTAPEAPAAPAVPKLP